MRRKRVEGGKKEPGDQSSSQPEERRPTLEESKTGTGGEEGTAGQRGNGSCGTGAGMAQRLRLYFGSGRSNTAPEILEGDAEEQQGDGGVAAPPPPVLLASREPAARQVPPRPLGARSEPSLKRSSSMFIPQLAAYAEPRPTKSSSMLISLQRAGGAANGEAYADDAPPPSYSPPGPAPAYTEARVEADVPRHPPPPYYSPDTFSSQTFFTEPELPKRRVFSFGSNGHSVYSICHPGVWIQRNADASDIQHVRILPYAGSGWTVKQSGSDQCSAVNGGTQRLVFQLQPHLNQDPNQQTASPSCADVGGAGGARGRRVARHPRIRTDRSLSHQRLLLENQPQETAAEDQSAEETQDETETRRVEARNLSNGCTFKISGDASRRQPHFKIYFTPGRSGDQDVGPGDEPARNNPKVTH